MNRKLATLTVAAAIGLALTAWDTRVITGHPWMSIYQEAPSASLPEHSHVSDVTFDHLDPTGELRRLFGRGGSATLDVVDLNASYFRADEMADTARAGDDPETAVEERRIPPPGHFAGLPDYSYGLYDWLNKNTTCPAFQDSSYTWRCHEFFGWLGGLNSVHFGSQATEMYAHHHRNALALARRAREMRETMTDAERDQFSNELKEAELLALAYEGYAQHFLQDRWAIGHMWERWNAPDPQQEPASLPEHIVIGGLAGLIHGSESLVNQHRWMEILLTRADPMSSPVAGPGDVAVPMQYRHVGADEAGPVTPGIGDERFQDALDRNFSLSSYAAGASDQALDVPTQLAGLRQCAGAGWSEVIRALGPNDAGGFGIYQAPLSASAPDFAVIDREDCWNMWATNQSMMIGLLGPNPERSLAFIAAVDFSVPLDGPTLAEYQISSATQALGDRAELVAYATRLWLYGRDEPDGTQVARGEMISFAHSLASLFGQEDLANPNTVWGFEEGGSYGLPSYVEPVGLIAESDGGPVAPLAETDVRGRDIQTLYGAFTGARSDYWCEHRDVLRELRAEPTDRNRQLCEVMAGRMYQGTHPSYGGRNSREREFQSVPVRSMCQISGSGVESDEIDDPDNPYWLDQGYVPSDATRQSHRPRFTDDAAVTNWCARVPVITLLDDPELRDQNVAALLYVDDNRLILNGRDFGDQPGLVMAEPTGIGRHRALESVISWRDTQVVLDVSDYDWDPGDDYILTLRPAYETSLWTRGPTVGEYYLRVREPMELETVTLDLGGSGPCMTAIPDFEIVNLRQSITPSMTPAELTDLASEFSEDVTRVREYFSDQLVCMQELAGERRQTLQEGAESGVALIEARRGQYYFLTQLSEPVSIGMMVNSPPHDQSDIDLWQDLYTTYIEQLQGSIGFLDGTDLMVQAWTRAYASNPPLTRGSVDISELMWSAGSVEEVLERGFQASQTNSPGGGPTMPREMMAMMQQVSFFAVGLDLEMLGDGALANAEETLRGLRTWTQVQHSLTQIAIPRLITEIDHLQDETERLLDLSLSEHTPEECTSFMDLPGCQVFSGDEANLDDYYELAEWIAELTGGIARPEPQYLSSMSGLFPTADGHQRSLLAWPTEESYQAAIAGPGRDGTQFVSPGTGTPK
jgi:hypothetical protein